MFFDCNSGAECPRPRLSYKNDSHDIALFGQRSERRTNLSHHGDVENVQRWARKRDLRYPIFNFEFDVLE